MTRDQQIEFLIKTLLAEMPEYRGWDGQFPGSRRRLLRALMNVRPPLPLDEGFLAVQDALLSDERAEKGVVDAMALPECPGHPGVALWQGDITRLQADAIVNAANSALLGCFAPCHGCIDNAIHSAAGLQLRDTCAKLMAEQGHAEPTGTAKLTAGYNLPAAHVLHTVGPIISGPLTDADKEALASCYTACLALAAGHGLAGVAFCCISTGEFHFPGGEAARIALSAVEGFLQRPSSVKKVVFNVFKDTDRAIYEELLGLR